MVFFKLFRENPRPGRMSGPRMPSPANGKPAAKFTVYHNPALSTAMTARSVDPSRRIFLFIFAAAAASAAALLAFSFRGDDLVGSLWFFRASESAAYFFVKVMQIGVGLVFVASLSALFQAISFRNAGMAAGCSSSNLTSRQLSLLGLKAKPVQPSEAGEVGKTTKRSQLYSEPLVPIHRFSGSNSSGIGSSSSGIGSGKHFVNTSGSPYTPSLSPCGLPSTSQYYRMGVSPSRPSPGSVSTPWLKRQWSGRDINSEAMFEDFLKDVDKSSAALSIMNSIQATPPPTVRGLGVVSPGPESSSGTTPGTKRSTPLRPVRMSPTSHKYATPPMKGEGEFPAPMSMEQMILAYERLGIYPQIEHWRDRLRQWFSSVLLNPLVEKIGTSHLQVMHAAAKVGYSITVSPVGSDSVTSTASPAVSPIDGAKEWLPMFTVDEDGFLHQLRAALVQARDGPSSQLSSFTSPSLQQTSMLPTIQECINAVTDHQRLLALMKGDLGKGVLPQSSVRADYTVQRVRELAEGTCVKNFEYLGNGEVYDKKHKKWTLELPTDSHLLVYLFCAFLEHPKWMLHVDPASYANTQSSKNPLFLGVLPPKERFPEKYVAVISNVPSVLHPGAFVLAVGRQSPPIFALYWDKKLQFSVQGRTALWDAILLFCHRVNVSFGGVVRGLHLNSPALSILPVLDTDVGDQFTRDVPRSH